MQEHKLKRFRLEDYTGKFIMHCDKRKQAKIFCKFLNKNGRKWIDNSSYLNRTSWEVYKAETAYYFNMGTYADYNFFNNENYIILEFDNFDWSREMKERFRLDSYTGNYAMHLVGDKQIDTFRKSLKVGISEGRIKSYKKSNDIVLYLDIDRSCSSTHEFGFDKFKNIISSYKVLEFDDFKWNKEEKEEMKYEIGKKYIVGDSEEDLKTAINKDSKILVGYIPCANYPFYCVNKDNEEEYKRSGKVHLTPWKYAKPLIEYKPYTEPKIEWVKEHKEIKMNDKTYSIQKILFFNEHYMLRLNDGYEYSLQYLFENITWQDGTPFGELIND